MGREALSKQFAEMSYPYGYQPYGYAAPGYVAPAVYPAPAVVPVVQPQVVVMDGHHHGYHHHHHSFLAAHGFPLCSSNDQCQNGFECLPIGVFRSCQPCQSLNCHTPSNNGCESDYDCPPNYQCALLDDTGRRGCLEAAPPLPLPMPRPLSCARDTDCILGQICQADYSGVAQCQEPTPGFSCRFNTDCRVGTVCVETERGYRRCLDQAPALPTPSPCARSQFCESGFICTVNQRPLCTVGNCRSTADCPHGKSCVDMGNGLHECLENITPHHHHRQYGCTSDEQCESGYSCDVEGSRTCVQNPSGLQRDQPVILGGWWSRCSTSTDCSIDLGCYTTNSNERMCAAVNGQLCISDHGCSNTHCLFYRFGDVAGNCARQPKYYV
ncbi:unnamed protein product, partial [Mesorhabditis spiculigera]